MTMMANQSPFSIPYSKAVNTTVTFDFSDAMKLTGFLPTPGLMDARHFTGGYLYWKNDTDFTLYGTYNVSGHQCYLLPGEGHFCPLNADDTNITWILQAKNPYQVHPQALLHCQYLDRGDIASGHQVMAAVGLNPSTPAAAVGPGALPVGVTITAPQVQTGAFPSGAWAFGSSGHATFIDIYGASANGDCFALHNDTDALKTAAMGYGVATESLGRGAWMFDHSNDVAGLIFSKATPAGITFNGTVAVSVNTTGGNVEVLDFTNAAANGHRYGFFIDSDNSVHIFDFTNSRDTKLMDTAGGMVTSGNFVANGSVTGVNGVFGTPSGATALQILATNGQGTRVATITCHATLNQNADVLDISRDTNQAATYTLGIAPNQTFYLYDVNNAAFATQNVSGLANNVNSGRIWTSRSAGGGNAGYVIFEGTTDPGGNAAEGDMWCGA